MKEPTREIEREREKGREPGQRGKREKKSLRGRAGSALGVCVCAESVKRACLRVLESE